MANVEDLNIEFYKQIKEEYRQYGFYIQTLTTMKFIAIAGVISLLITNEKMVDIFKSSLQIVSTGVLLIPITAFFIDLKVLEMTLHIRSISKFLSQKYAYTLIPEWEKMTWSKQFLQISRTSITLFTSAGISFLILWASLFLVGKVLMPEWGIFCLIGGLLFSVAGVLFTTKFFRKIWKA
ncbi:MAG: hypothetical protein QM802_18395 [Agriterribacter sp.]